MSPSAPSRPSGSHSIFLSLVAVYPEVITASQNKELPSPTYLTAVSVNLGPKNCTHQTTHTLFSESLVIPFCLDYQGQNYLQALWLRTWILALNYLIQILALPLPTCEISNYFIFQCLSYLICKMGIILLLTT